MRVEFDAWLAYEEIRDAKTPREALERVALFEGWFYGREPQLSRLYAWCAWLRENGYEGWVRYLRLMVRALSALVHGDPDEVEFYSRKLGETEKPEGWIDDFRNYLKEGRKYVERLRWEELAVKTALVGGEDG